jgi:hypothetical protein
MKPRVTLQSQASHTEWLSDRQSLERKPGTVFRASSVGPPSTGTFPGRLYIVPQKIGGNTVQLIRKGKDPKDSLKALANKELKVHVLLVNKWLLDTIQDLGRASTVLGQAFLITEKSSLDKKDIETFSLSMDKIPFLREKLKETKGGKGGTKVAEKSVVLRGGWTTRLEASLGEIATADRHIIGIYY